MAVLSQGGWEQDKQGGITASSNDPLATSHHHIRDILNYKFAWRLFGLTATRACVTHEFV